MFYFEELEPVIHFLAMLGLAFIGVMACIIIAIWVIGGAIWILSLPIQLIVWIMSWFDRDKPRGASTTTACRSSSQASGDSATDGSSRASTAYTPDFD